MAWVSYDEGPALIHWVTDVELVAMIDHNENAEKTSAFFRKGEEVMVDIIHDHGETVDIAFDDSTVVFNVQKVWFRRKRLKMGT